MKQVHILCSSNDYKPFYILEILFKCNGLEGYEIKILLDSADGRTVDLCNKYGKEYFNVGDDLIESKEIFSSLSADGAILVSLGWSKLIPKEIIDLYYKAINCHGGYLPDYRGPSAYMAAYANIEKEYGVTIHYMTEKFDDGNIIKQAKLKLFLEETPQILHYRMCELIALLLPQCLELVFQKYEGFKQKGTARYFKKMTREEMQNLRNKNVENMRNGNVLEIAEHREWKII